MSIGQRILELRQAKHVSQGDIASSLDVSRQAVSKWESDKSSPDTLNLIKLADLLETDLEYLATGRKSVMPPPVTIVKVIKAPVPPPLIQEKIVEKVVEKVVEKPVVKIIEKPVIRKVTRVKYRQNPFNLIVSGIVGLLFGLLLASLF